MKLFAGLGNPGAGHAGNRHNIGFMALEAIAAAHGFAPWRAKFQGRLTEGRLGAEKVLLLEPQTYMNLSGQSVGEAMRFYKLGPEDLVVFHDELDLAPGKVRLKRGGGHAGHNGLRSIDAHIGPEYTRVRLGIGHPGDKARVTAHVLGDFAKAEQAGWLPDLLEAVAAGAPALARGAGPEFLQTIAERMRPPTPPKPPKAAAGPEPEPAPEPEAPALRPGPFAALAARFGRGEGGQ